MQYVQLAWFFILLECTYALNATGENDLVVNYCQLDCFDVFKDMRYKNSGCDCSVSKACGNQLRVLTPSNNERRTIIQLHNGLREKIASGIERRSPISEGAMNMFALTYDHNLEYVAECWALKCNPTNDNCRRTDRFEKVGQNMFTSIGIDCDSTHIFSKAIEMWFEEISGMTLGCIMGYGSCEAVSAYSQLIWAKTTNVGCARIGLPGRTCHIFCNYGPAGNVLGQPLYTIGPPGKHCAKTDKKYKSLCAPIITYRRSGASRLPLYTLITLTAELCTLFMYMSI